MTRCACAARRREVALAEAQAVLAMVQDDERRGAARRPLAAVDEGEVEGDDAEALGELLELGLQTGRLRAALRPGRRAGRAAGLPPAAARAELGAARASVNEALAALGPPLEKASVHGGRARRVLVSVSAGGFELPSGSTAAARGISSDGHVTMPSTYYMACLDLEGRRCSSSAAERWALEKVAGPARAAARVSPSSRPSCTPSCARSTSSGASGRTARATSTARSSSSRRRRDRAVNERVHRDAEARAHALQRRGRARALQLHPAGGPPRGPDRGRRLDRRRVAGARAADPRRHRGVVGAEHAELAAAAARLRPWAKRALRDVRGAARLLPARSSRARRWRDGLPRRRRARRSGADHVRGLELVRRCDALVYDRARRAGARRRGAGRRAA